MTVTFLVIGSLCIVGLYVCGRGVMKLNQRRPLAASYRFLSGTSIVALSLALGALALNIHSYWRLTYEQDLAELTFHELGERSFEVAVKLDPSGVTQRYLLSGDEWQLDARVLKFHGLANLLGLSTSRIP